MPEDAGPIARWLRDELQRRGETQRAAAQEIGASKAAVSDWVAGLNQPVPEALRKIARWAVPHSSDPEKDAAAVEQLYARLMTMAGLVAPRASEYIPKRIRIRPLFGQYLALLETLPDDASLDAALRIAVDGAATVRGLVTSMVPPSNATTNPQTPQDSRHGG